jgi:endonuclease-3
MSDRATLLTKTAKVLKKHYKPVSPPSNRSVLEHLLYACCLEASHHQPSDDAFARLQETYFDLNEVRVTTVSELAEVMSGLNDPEKASRRLKKALQAVFEAHYSFDIDALKKGNLGKGSVHRAGCDYRSRSREETHPRSGTDDSQEQRR